MNPQIVTNSKGKKTGVFLTMKEYKEVIELYDENEDLEAYAKAKALGSDTISWEQAKAELRALGKI